MSHFSIHSKGTGEIIELKVVMDCPIYKLKKGKCSKCEHFGGVSPDINDEIKCITFELFVPYQKYMEKDQCPTKSGRCHFCESFLGFANNKGFYCASKHKG